MSKATVFKNLFEIKTPFSATVASLIKRIKDGASKDKVEDIRRNVFLGDEEAADKIKRTLPCVVFSAAAVQIVKNSKGEDSYREDASVVSHSGFLTLDFDDVADPELKISQLSVDPYIYAAWLSPSGQGVRALVKCPPSIENHAAYYTALLDRYPDLDKTSRNISRVTFESYDPSIFVNEDSLVWDRQVTEEQRRAKHEDTPTRRKGMKAISTAVAMVRQSYDGKKHEDLLAAANLLGGYIATGRVDEEHAVQVLLEEIRAKGPKNISLAEKTIRDGIEHGKRRPLSDIKQIEKDNQYLKRDDGHYDFLADPEEMDTYITSVIDGSLKMGLPTGLNGLNPHWLFKEHSLDFFCGMDNTGKSFLVWYLSVLAAKFHKWKFAIQSSENRDGELKKKIMEFFLGKSLKVASKDEIKQAEEFFQTHYRIISSKIFHTMQDCLTKCELLYDTGFQFDCVILEPYNSFEIPGDVDMYRNNIHNLNLLRTFKENYSSVWICDHINTNAARTKLKDGYIVAPGKADVEGGTMKANKCDNFIIIHRWANHPEKFNETQIHVEKIKSVETGGKRTFKDNPVILKMNGDFCGYSSNGVDPINKNRVYTDMKAGEQVKLV